MSNIVASATFDGYTGQLISACNIGSVTRVSPGLYKLCFSNPRPSVDYTVISSAQRDINSSYPMATGIAPGDQDTILLLNFEGSNGSNTFTDSSNYNQTVTPNGGVQIDAAVSKFGGGSGYFDGSGDYLSFTDSKFDFTSVDFTIEFWLRSDGATAGSIVQFGSATGYNQVNVAYDGTDLGYSFSHGSGWNTVVLGAISTTQFNHFAVTRQGNTIRTFKDGVLANTGTLTGTLMGTDGFVRIGKYDNGSGTVYYFKGWVDDLRITKGQALYTDDFTPPSNSQTVPGPMSRDCFYIETSANNTPTNSPLVNVVVTAGCDAGSSGGCKCC